MQPGFALDAPKTKSRSDYRKEQQKARETFKKAYAAERQYAIKLRQLARHIEDIIKAFDPRDPEQLRDMIATLRDYSRTIAPWAKATAFRMLADVSRRDERAWNEYTKGLADDIRREIDKAETGLIFRQLMQQQVTLITSLPLDAANRVHELAIGNIYEGDRSDVIVRQIMETGLVTKGRANLIARTETSRAASNFTQARAQHVGSEGYIWRTSQDPEVRPAIPRAGKDGRVSAAEMSRFRQMNTTRAGSHRLLEGKFIRWDNPPISGPRGERAHAGCIYNCRCFAEVVIPTAFSLTSH